MSAQRFELHKTLCNEGEAQQITLPNEGENVFKFTNFQSLIPYPFVLYADLETAIQLEVDILKNKMISKRVHVVIAVAAYTVCLPNDTFSSASPLLHVGYDCVEKFFDHLFLELKRIGHILTFQCKRLIMTDLDRSAFAAAETCAMCGIVYNPQNVKVRDHCHLSGRFRYALCSK